MKDFRFRPLRAVLGELLKTWPKGELEALVLVGASQILYMPDVPDFVKELVGWGAGPRAGISLITAAKAWAILHGRHHCTMKDVEAIAMPVLRHRVITTFAAEAAGVTSDDLVNMLLKELKPTLDLEI